MRPKPSYKYDWVKLSEDKYAVYNVESSYDREKHMLAYIEHRPKDPKIKEGFGSFDIFWVYFGTMKISNIPVGLKDLDYAKQEAEKKIARHIRGLRMQFSPVETGDENIMDTFGLNDVTETLRAHDNAFSFEPLTNKEKAAYSKELIKCNQWDVRVTDISAYHPNSPAGQGKVIARIVEYVSPYSEKPEWIVYKKNRWDRLREQRLAGTYPSKEAAMLAVMYWCTDSKNRNLTARIKLRLAEIDAELTEEQIKIVRSYMKPVLDYAGNHSANIFPFPLPKAVYELFEKEDNFEKYYKQHVEIKENQ